MTTRIPRNPGPTDPRRPGPNDLVLHVDGKEYRRIQGIWCRPTQEPGVWRSATWLGSITVHALLDYIHRHNVEHHPQPDTAAPPEIPGQLTLA